MRSLQEWQDYVEQQIEAAQRLREERKNRQADAAGAFAPARAEHRNDSDAVPAVEPEPPAAKEMEITSSPEPLDLEVATAVLPADEPPPAGEPRDLASAPVPVAGKSGTAEEPSSPATVESAAVPSLETPASPTSDRGVESHALISWGTTLPAGENSPDEVETEGAEPNADTEPRDAGAISTEPVEAPPSPDRRRGIPGRPETGSADPKSAKPEERDRLDPPKPVESSDPRFRTSVIPPRPRVSSPLDSGRTRATIPLPATPEQKRKLEALKQEIDALDPDGRTESTGVFAESDQDSLAANHAASTGRSGEEPTATAPATRQRTRTGRLTRGKTMDAAADSPKPAAKRGGETAEEAQELWNQVPRHLQALVRSQQDEVAQRSYKKRFRDSREGLIRRLLDPELNLEEVARILCVCPTTVRRYTNRGLLPHHRTSGNQRRFRLSDVLDFMDRYGQVLGLPDEASADEADEWGLERESDVSTGGVEGADDPAAMSREAAETRAADPALS